MSLGRGYDYYASIGHAIPAPEVDAENICNKGLHEHGQEFEKICRCHNLSNPIMRARYRCPIKSAANKQLGMP